MLYDCALAVAPLSWLCCLIKISDVFYPRDYARAGTIVLWCVRVCPPVTSRCSVKSDEWINVFFGMGVSFDQSYTVF